MALARVSSHEHSRQTAEDQGEVSGMNWKLKARLQNLIAMLPSSLGYHFYYYAQRHFGGLRSVNPIMRLQAGVGIMDRIRQHNQAIESQTFLEIGTGRSVSLPIALWLCGASRVITVDLNPYLKPELVSEDISFMRNNQQAVKNVFGSYSHQPIFQERFERLLTHTCNMSMGRLLSALNIECMAPADATMLALESHSVDYHVSYTVLEHIHPEILHGILLEGQRILRKEGLFVHRIDMSDHFSHSDTSISAINFLRFNEDEWSRYAGNRYMYQNRLRVDDYVHLIEKVGLEVLSMEPEIDQRALQELTNGFRPNERFQTKTKEINATRAAWIVVKQQGSPPPVGQVGGANWRVSTR
jgi:hypothetical protein